MKKSRTVFVIALLCLSNLLTFSQQKMDLAAELKKDHFEAVNRTIVPYGNSTSAVEMNAAEGSGLGILSEVEFETGTIELDILGENNPGKSFIGIAFNIQDEENYEAV